MKEAMQMGQFTIGHDRPCFTIAEAGVNHNGNMDLAHRLIDEAAKSGVDAVKFQSFVTEKLVTPKATKAVYQIETTGSDGDQFAMLKALELSAGQQAELKKHCDEIGILYLCTPYEEESVDLLDHLGVAGYKIGSTDTTNLPFLRYVAKKGRPVILSSGMCTLGEVEMAVNTVRSNGLENHFAMLQCVSEYPAPLKDVNLRVINTYRQAFGCPVGFSDHTQGVVASSWAVAIGACIVEKHFTLDRNLSGPDHRASLEPSELKQYVDLIRQVELALGTGVKIPTSIESDNKNKMQKSLVAVREIKAGQTLSEGDLTSKRPGSGLPPWFMNQVVGRRARRAISANELINLDALD